MFLLASSNNRPIQNTHGKHSVFFGFYTLFEIRIFNFDTELNNEKKMLNNLTKMFRKFQINEIHWHDEAKHI